MTKASLFRWCHYAILTLIGGYLTWAIISLLVSLATKNGNNANHSLFFLAFGLLCLASIAVPAAIARLKCGAVILNCGFHPEHWKFLALSIGILAIAGQARPALPGFEGFAILFAAFWFLVAIGKLVFCENGIVGYWFLMPWTKIKNIEWLENDQLAIYGQGKFGEKVSKLPIPEIHHEKVNQLVNQFLLEESETATS